MSRRCGARFGRCIGAIWFSRRRVAQDNLQRAFPSELTSEQIKTTTRGVFGTMGQTIFEVLRFGITKPEDLLTRVEGDDTQLRRAYEQGKGAVLVSGHFGNWEMLGAWVRACGYPLDVVVKPMRNPLVDAYYNRCRAHMDVGVIHSQLGTKDILRALQQNRFVAILVDQYAGAEGVDVDFFGRPASTPRGPAALALKFGCPILSGVMEQHPDGRLIAHIDGPVEHTPTGNTDEDIRIVTQELTRRLEAHIRRLPEQWLWTHRRWRD